MYPLAWITAIWGSTIDHHYANSGIAFLPRGDRPYPGHFVRPVFAGAVQVRSMSNDWPQVRLRLLGCATFPSPPNDDGLFILFNFISR